MCMPAVVSPARYFRELGLLPTHEPGGRYAYRGGEARAARRWEWHVVQGSTQSAPVKGKGRSLLAVMTTSPLMLPPEVLNFRLAVSKAA